MKRRAGFSMTEVLVASAIFALLVGTAMRTFFFNRRAADTTLRVGALQEVRGVLTQVTHDLQVAVAIERPGWASASNTLEYLDDQYQRVTIYPGKADGSPYGEGEVELLPETAEVRLWRELKVVGQPPERKRIDRGVRLRAIRFFRLGRSLLGMRIDLKGNPHASTKALQRGETFSSVVALDRQVQ